MNGPRTVWPTVFAWWVIQRTHGLGRMWRTTSRWMFNGLSYLICLLRCCEISFFFSIPPSPLPLRYIQTDCWTTVLFPRAPSPIHPHPAERHITMHARRAHLIFSKPTLVCAGFVELVSMVVQYSECLYSWIATLILDQILLFFRQTWLTQRRDLPFCNVHIWLCLPELRLT